MTTWEEKFVRFVAERWVFQGTDPHEFTPRVFLIGMGEDFVSPPLLERHKHFGALYTGYLSGQLVGYMRVPPGTVILEGLMRSLAFTRVDTVIGVGTCGGLQQEIACGDIIVATQARAGDCLSPQYGFAQNSDVPADGELSGRLTGYIRRTGLPVHTGPIITTGAAFRESDELIDTWEGDGYLGVELESSSLFALARFQGMKAAAALLVTDSPVRREINPGVLKGRQREQFIGGIVDLVGSGAY